MSSVNQRGDPVSEEHLFAYAGGNVHPQTDQDRDDAIALLCQHLGVQIWRTNATKHGATQVEMRTEDTEDLLRTDFAKAVKTAVSTAVVMRRELPPNPSVHDIFSKNCVNHNGNYEVTPGQAEMIFNEVARLAVATYRARGGK